MSSTQKVWLSIYNLVMDPECCWLAFPQWTEQPRSQKCVWEPKYVFFWSLPRLLQVSRSVAEGWQHNSSGWTYKLQFNKGIPTKPNPFRFSKKDAKMVLFGACPKRQMSSSLRAVLFPERELAETPEIYQRGRDVVLRSANELRVVGCFLVFVWCSWVGFWAWCKVCLSYPWKDVRFCQMSQKSAAAEVVVDQLPPLTNLHRALEEFLVKTEQAWLQGRAKRMRL